MKKMLPWLVSLLVAITLIAVAFVVIYKNYFSGSGTKDPSQKAREAVQNVKTKPITADEMIKVTSELTDIKTNTANPDYVVIISFTFQLENEKAKQEFDKIKDIRVKPIVNRALWKMKPEDFSVKGKDQLCAGLINDINDVLSEGKLTKVDIKDFIMSPV